MEPPFRVFRCWNYTVRNANVKKSLEDFSDFLGVYLGPLRTRRGLRAMLLVDALRRAATAARSVGVYGVDVMALQEKARAFYVKYGFVAMRDAPRHLFLPMETARMVAGMTAG